MNSRKDGLTTLAPFMKITKFLRNEDLKSRGGHVERKWWLVDAENQTLGRLASRIAMILRGKDKPHYTPHVDGGSYVVVVNAGKIHLSGKKMLNKTYYRHTGYPGGLKSAKAFEKLEKDPCSLIRSAVKGMMPKNALNRNSIRKLKIYAGTEHKHHANQPEPLEITYKPSQTS